MKGTYRGLSLLHLTLGLPSILLVIALWEFALEPLLHADTVESFDVQLEYFFTASTFAAIAMLAGSAITYYLGARLDRERATQAQAGAMLALAQSLGRVGHWEWRRSDNQVILSPIAQSILRIEQEGNALSLKAFLSLIHPADRVWMREELQKMVFTRSVIDHTHMVLAPDGATIHVRSRMESLIDPDNPELLIGVNGAIHDVSEQVEAHNRLRLHAAVFTHSSEAIMVTGPDGVIADVNPAFVTLTGYAAKEVIGHPPSILKSGVHPRSFYAEMWDSILSHGSWRGEIRNRVKDGTVVPMELYISAIPNERGKPLRFVAILSDMSKRSAYEENLLRLSTTDPLTGVANRRAFDEALEMEWRRCMRKQTTVTLLMVDIDHFKLYNDRYGHPEGDRCLKGVAELLDLLVNRPGDLVARYGGEEFAVILPETNQAEGLLIAETMREAVIEGCPTAAPRNGDQPVTISIGVASIVPGKGESPDTLVRRADEALYRAKAEGRNRTTLADMVDHRKE